MGRPRSFDEADVLRKAMDCFWARGYEASSLDDLCGAMGISRSSFYQCFGNKHDLLLATLDRYGDETLERMAATFAAGRSFGEALADFLDAAIADAGAAAARDDGGSQNGIQDGSAGGNAQGRGCYLGNCAAELAAIDREAAACLDRTFSRISDAFAGQIRAAQGRGEIDAARDPMALAHLLMAGLQGLRLVAKTKPDGRVLSDIADGLLQAVRRG